MLLYLYWFSELKFGDGLRLKLTNTFGAKCYKFDSVIDFAVRDFLFVSLLNGVENSMSTTQKNVCMCTSYVMLLYNLHTVDKYMHWPVAAVRGKHWLVLQSYQTRRVNRLAVRPILHHQNHIQWHYKWRNPITRPHYGYLPQPIPPLPTRRWYPICPYFTKTTARGLDFLG